MLLVVPGSGRQGSRLEGSTDLASKVEKAKMLLDPRSVLDLCVGSTALVWMLLVLSAVAGRPSGLGFALVTLCLCNTGYLYWRYKGIVW